MKDHLSKSLQEDVLTLLAYSDEHGKIIANTVPSNLFEGVYSVIAERVIQYWKEQHQAPKAHLSTILSDILDDKSNRESKSYRYMLEAMAQLAEDINANFVMSKLQKFIRMQRMKHAILESAEKLQAEETGGIEEVERIWNDLLTSRDISFDRGLKLGDFDVLLDYLTTRSGEFCTGIKELDKAHVVPARGEVMVLVGPAKKGKTWFLTQIGKAAFQMRKKVLHISLEVAKELQMQRYYQALFSISKYKASVKTFPFIYEDKKWKGLYEDEVVPDFAFDSMLLREELFSHMASYTHRLNNFIIQQFPPRSLTPAGLRAYLDNLEMDGFVPDILILDYVALMRTDERNHRISLGRVFEEFRAICVERNIAGVTVHQATRKGATSPYVGSTDIAEDWSIIGTADTILTYSCTDQEFRYGLGRIYVSNCRTAKDRWVVLLSQCYEIGQFCLDSVLLPPKYFDVLNKMKKAAEDDKEDTDDAEEDN